MKHCCRREQNIDNDAIIPAITRDGVVITCSHADQRSLHHSPPSHCPCQLRPPMRATPGAQAAGDAAMSRY